MISRNQKDGHEFGYTILEELPPVTMSQAVTDMKPTVLLNNEIEKIVENQATDEMSVSKISKVINA